MVPGLVVLVGLYEVGETFCFKAPGEQAMGAGNAVRFGGVHCLWCVCQGRSPAM
jgi:hypothetical protein